MINRSSKLSLVKQCHALDIARSGAYYQPKPTREADQMLMRLIDEIHLAKPFLGIRRLKDALHDLGHIINRKRVQRLMRIMDIQAIDPKANLSKANKQPKIYPYLLSNLDINRPNQVWCTDVAYSGPS